MTESVIWSTWNDREDVDAADDDSASFLAKIFLGLYKFQVATTAKSDARDQATS